MTESGLETKTDATTSKMMGQGVVRGLNSLAPSSHFPFRLLSKILYTSRKKNLSELHHGDLD
jgi:hypothetical protein